MTAPVREHQRTPAGEATRLAIMRSAQRLFLTEGYAATSVRGIAADAGVDPALVIRYFGSKEQLFLDVVDADHHFDDVMSGPLEGLGRRLVASIFGPGHHLRVTAYRGVMGAIGSPAVRARLGEVRRQMFQAPLEGRLSGDDQDLRIRLIAAQISGLLDALALMGEDVIAIEEREAVIALYGDAIQLLIDPTTH